MEIYRQPTLRKMATGRALLCVLGIFCANEKAGKDDSIQLVIESLMKGYNTPLSPDRLPLPVTVNFILKRILSYDGEERIIKLNGWLGTTWNDSRLVWDEGEFPGVNFAILPTTHIYVPDIQPYNTIEMDQQYPVSVTVASDGTCEMYRPMTMTIACHQKEADPPNMCSIYVGSWASNDKYIHVEPLVDGIDLSTLIRSPHYPVLNTSASRQVSTYDCCPDMPFALIKYDILLG